MKKKPICVLIVAVYTFLFLPLAQVGAQTDQTPLEDDLISPLIQHDSLTQSMPTGKALQLQATITDNGAVKEVVLFYRKMGATEYSKTNMNRTGSDVYSATIPKEVVMEPGLEYYIQASDGAGNTVMRGIAFSPLLITVATVIPPTIAATNLSSTTKPASSPRWYKKWWVWAIVGVVVVGAVAGGDGGGEESQPPAGPSGAVVITAPIPQ